MIGILITIILALAGLLAVKLVLNEVVHWRAVNTPQGLFALVEPLRALLQAATAKLQPPETESSPPMPDEITRLANTWPDQWAREGMEKHAKELYKVHQDWSKVYQQLLQEEGTED